MKKRVLSVFLALLLTLPLALTASAFTTLSFIKTARLDTNITFTREDFVNRFYDPALTLTGIQIVDNLPSDALGVLKLGDTPVVLDQVILVANLPNLVFVPKKDAFGYTDFKYKGVTGNTDADEAADPSTVTLVIEDILPVTKDLSFSTGRNVPLSANLSATDEKGRELTYIIVDAPTHGDITKAPGADDPGFTYTPESDYIGVDTFTYRATAAAGAKISNLSTVTIYVGGAPTADNMTVVAERNVPKDITLKGADPQNRTMTYVIVTQPKNGVLAQKSGAVWTYTPTKNYLGADSFTYKVTVNGGAVSSNTATVTIDVRKYEIEPMAYADMTNHWGATSAGSLGTLGFIVGERVTYAVEGGTATKYYFGPERPVTRGEFILWLTAALRIHPDTSMVSPFYDDVPAWLLGPSNAAYKAGIIMGEMVGSRRYLNQSERLTRLEAVVMIDRAMDLTSKTSTVPDFADWGAVPDWGRQAVKNLHDYGIVVGDERNNFNPFQALTRAESAEVLFKSYKQAILENR
ncbi:MAG: S-layer homology domain-containing protein [Oscillospiraceae bacterium]|jgi:hypothetical protein|nr:S-layer homology domain-containing protein [Oscillospiraceae bacterium]